MAVIDRTMLAYQHACPDQCRPSILVQERHPMADANVTVD